MNAAPARVSAASLWRYCVAIYRRRGVRAECLALQRRLGVNVNLLLLGAYIGAELGAELGARDVAAAARAISAWHSGVVSPLRKLRQRTKPAGAKVARSPTLLQALNRRLLAAELVAERVELADLAAWCERHRRGWRRGERGAAVAHNLRGVLHHAGGGSGARRLQAAAGAGRRARAGS